MSNEKKFRLNTKCVFITMPQCTISKEEALKTWQHKFRNQGIEDYLIAQELHEDGNTHLHAAFFLEKRCDFHTANCLDLEGHHGSYETIKNKIATIRYLLKEDPSPLGSRDWEQWLNLTTKHQKVEKNQDFLQQMLEKGPKKMVEEGTLSLMKLQMAQANLAAYKKIIEEEKIAESKEDVPAFIDNPWGIPIEVNTEIKKCHYWLYSSMPNLGKTTWATDLCSKYKAEYWNYLEIYQPQISKHMELIILDEFRGQLKITQLNSICDGNYWFTGKNMAPWKLDQKAVVIILANRSPGQIYKNMEDIALISARFKVVCLDKYKKNEEENNE